MATCLRTHRLTHSHTIQPPTAGVRQVGHTSIKPTSGALFDLGEDLVGLCDVDHLEEVRLRSRVFHLQ